MNVLLIEDDTDLATIATLGLQKFSGFTVHWFASTESALTYSGAPIDLVLMDRWLNGVDSLLNFTDIVEQFNVPIVLATSDQVTAKPAQIAAVLSKPFDIKSLGAKLREIEVNHKGRVV